MKLKQLITLFLLLTTIHIDAVDIYSRKLSTDNGLPDNNVRNIAQDEKGFIWIGTPNGLHRFDGYFYTSYHYDETGNNRFLNNNRITRVESLQSGLMLIREQGERFSLFDTQTNRFVEIPPQSHDSKYRNHKEYGNDLWLWGKANGCMNVHNDNHVFSFSYFNTDNKELRSNHVQMVCKDAQNTIWISTDEGVYYINDKHAVRTKSNKTITCAVNIYDKCYMITSKGEIMEAANRQLRTIFNPQSKGIHIDNVITAADFGKESIIIVTSTQTYVFDTKNHAMSPCSEIQAPDGNLIYDNLGNPVVLDKNGDIWYIDRKTDEIIHLHIFDQHMLSLVTSWKYKVVTAEESGLIWISTNGCGITVYDKKNHSVQKVSAESGHLSTNYILDICLDHDENIWAIDEFYGIAYLTVPHINIHNILLNQLQTDIHENQVNIMRWVNSNLILITNTDGDIYKTDAQLNIPEQPWKTNLDVHSVCMDKDSVLWIATRQHGLWIGETEYVKNYNDPSTLSSDKIWYLFKDNAGRMWVATEDSYLELAVKKTDGSYSFKHYCTADFGAKILTQDHHGVIWVGTKSGLYRFKPDEIVKKPSAYEQILNKKDTRNSDVSSIFEDSKQRLWVGTIGKGIYFRDNRQEGNTFENFTTANGLNSNEVQSIIEDRFGIIWITTKKGITCYDPEKKTFRYIYNNYNLQHNYYTENCACMLPDGRLAFGTNQGIIVYTPEMPKSSGKSNSLAITDFLINGVSVSSMDESPIQTAPDKASEISLAYNQNSITVRFSNFNYTTTVGTQYSYYLENYDKEWSELSPLSFAAYKNLSPGKYILHIKAYGNDTLENAEKQLTIVIRHPWWSTWWAYLIYLLLLAGFGYVIYRQLRTVYSLRRRISIEKELTEYKLVFFTNISHEFRTPLTIIRGAMDKIRTTKNVPGELKQPISTMGKSVDRMLRLINQLLEFRKMQNGKLRLALQETDIIAFLRDIYDNFLEIADKKHINFTFLPKTKNYTMYVDQAHVDKIVFNILSNAFKYTPAKGTIVFKVGFDEEHEKMIIRIEDSGVGIPKDKQPELFKRFMQSTFTNNSTGIGLHLTQELVHVHKGTIRFEENKPTGSIFIVELPTNKNVFSDNDFLAEEHKLLDNQDAEKVKTNLEYRELQNDPLNDNNILIVDDDTDMVNYLADIVGKYFHVAKALDGTEALNIIQEKRPDLIISDVSMPIMDGYELTTRIRKDQNLHDIPIILLTALTGEGNRLKGEDKGADAYLTKPFDTKLLIATCRKLIKQRTRLRETYSQQQTDRTAPAIKQALPEIIVEERDKQFLDILELKIYNNLDNPSLSVDSLAESMGYKRTIFFKKVKLLTGQTPADYIRTQRLGKAVELLRDDKITVAEVAYMVGISDPHYFTKVFKQQYGISPKKYQQGNSHIEKKEKPQ